MYTRFRQPLLIYLSDITPRVFEPMVSDVQ